MPSLSSSRRVRRAAHHRVERTAGGLPSISATIRAARHPLTAHGRGPRRTRRRAGSPRQDARRAAGKGSAKRHRRLPGEAASTTQREKREPRRQPAQPRGRVRETRQARGGRRAGPASAPPCFWEAASCPRETGRLVEPLGSRTRTERGRRFHPSVCSVRSWRRPRARRSPPTRHADRADGVCPFVEGLADASDVLRVAARREAQREHGVVVARFAQHRVNAEDASRALPPVPVARRAAPPVPDGAFGSRVDVAAASATARRRAAHRRRSMLVILMRVWFTPTAACLMLAPLAPMLTYTSAVIRTSERWLTLHRACNMGRGEASAVRA